MRLSARGALWSAVAFVALLALSSTRASAQRTRCELVPQPTTRFATDTVPGGGRVTFVGGGVLIRCPARDITLKGDSAEQYPDRDFMIGHVVYDEPRFHITSNFLNRYLADDRIVAIGDVHASLPSGSTLVGPIAELRREIPRVRRQQIIARQRPTINIVEKDSAGKPVPPTSVIADSIFMDGDSLIYGSGQVIITRTDIRATADSAFIDQGRETMRLWKKPELNGRKDRPFRLNGREILMYSKNRKLQRVLAVDSAIAVSDSMTLKSDTIDLRVSNDVLDHAYAFGKKSRARAESPSQNLLADSLDVRMPNQKIQEVRALRGAFAEARADTVRFKADSGDAMDWLRGDTIVAHFDTTGTRDTSKSAAKAAKDTTSKSPTIKQLVASGHASSYYHLAPNDSAEKRPAIDYLVARLIRIDFDQQRVATVTAVDSVSGVYVEPRAERRASTEPATPRPTSVVPLPPPRIPPAKKP